MDNVRVKDIYSWLGKESEDNRIVYDISISSSFKGTNWVYLCYKGKEHDGKDYILEAKRNGAITIIYEEDNPNLKERIEEIGYKFYGKTDINLIGVTGTTGKSTIAYLLSSFYNLLGRKSLLITSTKDMDNSYYSERTTPDILTLLRVFKKAKKDGYKNIIMECSSIGIATERISSLKFKSILLSLITSDHLDFHKTKHNYKMAKINYLKSNTDKVYLLKNNKDKKYFKHDKRLRIINDKVHNPLCTLSSTEFTYLNKRFKTSFLLKFNIQNVILVLGYLLDNGFNINTLKRTLERIKPIPGRIEKIKEDIYIDYAHTASAVNSLLKEVSKICYKPLIVVIGAGGERDKSKRKDYQRSLKRYADFVILTNDNPRKEDQYKILEELKGKEDFIIIPDRRKAIEFALSIYYKNKTILVVGKGREDYQEINGIKYPFSDKKVILKCLKN